MLFMKRKLFFAVCLVLCVMVILGCAGISDVGIAEYLDGIPVEMPDLSLMADDEYTGEYTITLPPGAVALLKHVSVSVTVSDCRLTSIRIAEPKALNDEQDFIDYGNRIIEEQSFDVDGVSGASFTSKSYVKAIENALIDERGD